MDIKKLFETKSILPKAKGINLEAPKLDKAMAKAWNDTWGDVLTLGQRKKLEAAKKKVVKKK